MAPPSMIDFVLSRKLADGIAIVGCSERSCFNRLGVDWTNGVSRMIGIPTCGRGCRRNGLTTIWASSTDLVSPNLLTDEFRSRLPQPSLPNRGGDESDWRSPEFFGAACLVRDRRPFRWRGVAVDLSTYRLGSQPTTPLVKLSFSHGAGVRLLTPTSGRQKNNCRNLRKPLRLPARPGIGLHRARHRPSARLRSFAAARQLVGDAKSLRFDLRCRLVTHVIAARLRDNGPGVRSFDRAQVDLLQTAEPRHRLPPRTRRLCRAFEGRPC